MILPMLHHVDLVKVFAIVVMAIASSGTSAEPLLRLGIDIGILAMPTRGQRGLLEWWPECQRVKH